MKSILTNTVKITVAAVLAPDPHRVRRPGKSFYSHGTSQRILTDKTRFYDCAKQQDVTSLKFYFIFYPTKSALFRL